MIRKAKSSTRKYRQIYVNRYLCSYPTVLETPTGRHNTQVFKAKAIESAFAISVIFDGEEVFHISNLVIIPTIIIKN